MSEEEFNSLADGSWKYEIESLRQQATTYKTTYATWERVVQGKLAACEKRAKECKEREARLMARVEELEQVIQSHGIAVKSHCGGEAHYCTGEQDAKV
jgi:DNA repair ATPase RecN